MSDLEKCSEFLERIGLKAMRKLEKFRHTWRLDDVSVDIDTWPKIPTYAEIEGPSVEAIKGFCDKATLNWEKRFDGDAREVAGYD